MNSEEVRRHIIHAFNYQLLGTTLEDREWVANMLPIAWSIAIALQYNPVTFCRDIGYGFSFMQEEGFVTDDDAHWFDQEKTS